MGIINISLANEMIEFPPNFFQYTQGDTVNLTINPVDFPAGTEFTVNWTGASNVYSDWAKTQTVVYDGVNPIVINKQLAITGNAATAYTQVKVVEPISGVNVMSYILIVDTVANFKWGYLNAYTYYPLPDDTVVTEGMMIGINLKTTGIELYKDIRFVATGTATNEDYSIRFNSVKYDAGNSNVYFIINEDDLVEGDETITISLPDYADRPNSSFTFTIKDATIPPAPKSVKELMLEKMSERQSLVAGVDNQIYLIDSNILKYME